MKIIRCMVLEDEEPAQNLLRHYFKRMPELELVKVFDNALEAADFLEDNTIDLILTDIDMPRLTGLDFIRMLSPKPHLIIITAYSQHALEAFDLSVIDYIKKPASFERFKQAIEKVQRLYINHKEEMASGEASIYVKENGKTIKLEYGDIIYVEGLGDYVKIFTKERSIITLSTMSKLETSLPASIFMRVHKSFIININEIKSIDSANSLVMLSNKTEITLGRTYKSDFLKRFKTIN